MKNASRISLFLNVPGTRRTQKQSNPPNDAFGKMEWRSTVALAPGLSQDVRTATFETLYRGATVGPKHERKAPLAFELELELLRRV